MTFNLMQLYIVDISNFLIFLLWAFEMSTRHHLIEKLNITMSTRKDLGFRYINETDMKCK
jgi:hypothetical protein